MNKALEGLVVLDLSQVYQGPYCTLLMAYHGAKVIKVESPKGDILRERHESKAPHEFVMFNTNKYGITLDLKSEDGKKAFLKLVETADILVENFTPGVMKRLGLDYDEVLKKRNPKLIYATATAYGLTGPYRDYPGMDLTVQAIGGVMSSTGYPDMPPVKAGPAVADLLGGTHLLAGIGLALYQRERTGAGQKVEVSMHDALYPTLASPLAALYDGDPDNYYERTGNKHSGLRAAPYNVYPAKDGFVAIICATERHWRLLVDILERPDLLEKEEFKNSISRAAHIDEVDQIVSEWTQDINKWEIVELLTGKGVPASPVLTIKEVANDKHLIEREMIVEIDHPARGKVKIPGSPIKLSKSDVDSYQPAPLLGQHNEEILGNSINKEGVRI
ncbi:CaiB/BaiF CoA transferase family protein [Psychrobacillus soli]|uniref:CoA transferase n=1 Tax=Psychrobacillus soli TaxID=1543965 RepID=A0A544STR2_9BACI|nr:CoA transferase [Psychrobacillus soli]TQR08577.1 CoA transferase [Psychrobacillus soli]